MRKTILLCTLFLSIASLAAQADDDNNTYACGSNRNKGPAAAEIGLVDGMDGHEFYVGGVKQPDDKATVNGVEGGYVVNQDDLQYRFTAKSVEVWQLPVKGPAKKIGEAKACVSHMMSLD